MNSYSAVGNKISINQSRIHPLPVRLHNSCSLYKSYQNKCCHPLLQQKDFTCFKIYNSESVIRFIIALIQQCIEAAGTEKPRYLLQVQTYMAFHTGLPGIVAPAVVCTSPHGHTIFSCCQHVETRTAPAIFNSSAMIIIFIDADMRNSERI